MEAVPRVCSLPAHGSNEGAGRFNITARSASRPSGEWRDDDYDVLADGEAVGPLHSWFWGLAYIPPGQDAEAAMAAVEDFSSTTWTNSHARRSLPRNFSLVPWYDHPVQFERVQFSS